MNQNVRNSIKAKWEKLKLKGAKSLVQHIKITEFGIDETQQRTTHFVDDDNPTIFIVTGTETSLATSFISQHLAHYFQSPTLKSDIALILNTPQCSLSGLLKGVMDVPELPESWTESFDADPVAVDLIENSESEISGQIESLSVEISPNEVKNIFHIVQATIREDDGRIHDKVVEFEMPRIEPWNNGIDSITGNINSLTIKGFSHTSTSSTSEPRRMSRSSMSLIPYEEDDPEEAKRNREIGFAGELYVPPALESHLYDRYSKN